MPKVRIQCVRVFLPFAARYVNQEKMRRFWIEERQMFLKEFMSTTYQSNFVKRHVKEFVEQIDKFLKLNGVLAKNFNVVC